MTLDDIRPTQRENVLDLVEKAGHSNWERNRANSSRWSFVEEGKPVVIAGWFEDMMESDGVIRLEMDLHAESQRHHGVKRSRDTDRAEALAFAYQALVSVRMIVCLGKADPKTGRASRVRKRGLDSEPWFVTSWTGYDGICVVTRRHSRPPGWLPGELPDVRLWADGIGEIVREIGEAGHRVEGTMFGFRLLAAAHLTFLPQDPRDYDWQWAFNWLAEHPQLWERITALSYRELLEQPQHLRAVETLLRRAEREAKRSTNQ